MSATISQLRALINNALDAEAANYGENSPVSAAQQDIISAAVDSKNETWNPNLPPRH